MTVTKIWQRYFLSEILKIFFLFLPCFFCLYVLVDYSMHMQEMMKSKHLSIKDLAIYYGMLFSKRCDLLLPLALLIASVKVLTSLNHRNELLAFQTSGIAVYRLTQPFFFVALICVGLSYGNFEILAPKALTYIDHFENKYLKKKTAQKATKQAVHALALEDGTRLLYQQYEAEKKEFFDLFWILSIDEIYHIKTLKVVDSTPIGTFVDHLIRTASGEIKKIASFPSLVFNQLNLNFDLQDHLSTPIENRSISTLVTMALGKTPLFYEHRSAAQTHLYFKLFMPWLPVLVLIGVFPCCVPSVRFLPTFLIFSVTIFGYITFFTVMDGCVILGETEVLPSFWAIFTLPIAFFATAGARFIKMCVRSL
ncbi:MAG: LptF/LptG family permease [Simkaniaceae bacterium]|nr:LptF/LptG family permease [Simkaniaceae bacterium]